MTLNSDYIEKKWKGSRRLFTFHRSLINSFIGQKKKNLIVIIIIKKR